MANKSRQKTLKRYYKERGIILIPANLPPGVTFEDTRGNRYLVTDKRTRRGGTNSGFRRIPQG